PSVTRVATKYPNVRAFSRWPSLSGRTRGNAVMAGVIAAVLGLGKDVRPEDRACSGSHDVVDPAVVGAVIEVVDPLVALVPEPPVVLEADGPCHGPARYSRAAPAREESAHWGRSLRELAGKRLEVRCAPGRGHLPDGLLEGVWLGFARWSSGR